MCGDEFGKKEWRRGGKREEISKGIYVEKV